MTSQLKPLTAGPDETDRNRVLVIDDDASVSQSITLALNEAGLEAEAVSNPITGLNWAVDADPCCIVVDLKMPGIEGLDLIGALCALNRHAVIVISAFIDVETTVQAMRMGVADVLRKPVEPEVLIAALTRARKDLAAAPLDGPPTLTPREQQVAALIVEGRTTKQIALSLELSPRTVEFFRASLLRKTRSPNTAALVSMLARQGVG